MICVVIWVILCSYEEFGRIYSAFRSSLEASITVSLSCGPQTFRDLGSTDSVCACINVCVHVCENKGPGGGDRLSVRDLIAVSVWL